MDTDTNRVCGFEDYVRSRQDALLRSARRLTPNAADAQDLLQTALARTFPVWDGITDKRHADAYVRRVLINTRTTWWRARKLEEYPTDQLPESTVGDGAEQRADRAMLLHAMRVLSPRQRSVVVLRYYEGMSTAETADALGISLGTVKSTLHRALARLREELEHQDAREAALAAAVRPGTGAVPALAVLGKALGTNALGKGALGKGAPGQAPLGKTGRTKAPRIHENKAAA